MKKHFKLFIRPGNKKEGKEEKLNFTDCASPLRMAKAIYRACTINLSHVAVPVNYHCGDILVTIVKCQFSFFTPLFLWVSPNLRPLPEQTASTPSATCHVRWTTCTLQSLVHNALFQPPLCSEGHLPSQK